MQAPSAPAELVLTTNIGEDGVVCAVMFEDDTEANNFEVTIDLDEVEEGKEGDSTAEEEEGDEPPAHITPTITVIWTQAESEEGRLDAESYIVTLSAVMPDVAPSLTV